MSLSGIAGLLHVSQLEADCAHQQAAADAESERTALEQRTRLNDVLSSSSILDQLRLSNASDSTLASGQLSDSRASLDSVVASEFDRLGANLEVAYEKLEAECKSNIEALRDQISTVDLDIKNLLNEIQTARSAEQALKDSVAAKDDTSNSNVQSRLEEAAQTHKDVLDSFGALFR